MKSILHRPVLQTVMNAMFTTSNRAPAIRTTTPQRPPQAAAVAAAANPRPPQMGTASPARRPLLAPPTPPMPSPKVGKDTMKRIRVEKIEQNQPILQREALEKGISALGAASRSGQPSLRRRGSSSEESDVGVDEEDSEALMRRVATLFPNGAADVSAAEQSASGSRRGAALPENITHALASVGTENFKPAQNIPTSPVDDLMEDLPTFKARLSEKWIDGPPMMPGEEIHSYVTRLSRGFGQAIVLLNDDEDGDSEDGADKEDEAPSIRVRFSSGVANRAPRLSISSIHRGGSLLQRRQQPHQRQQPSKQSSIAGISQENSWAYHQQRLAERQRMVFPSQ